VEGRSFYPDDAELLYREGDYREGMGDYAGAEACWRRLIDGREGPHFASVGAGLRGYLARHRLALLCLRREALQEAEMHWRAALAEKPDLAEAWQGLQELERRRGQPIGDGAGQTGGISLAFSLTADSPPPTFDGQRRSHNGSSPGRSPGPPG
jgi:tetratricopeptide (TPR) repeat protein